MELRFRELSFHSYPHHLSFGVVVARHCNLQGPERIHRVHAFIDGGIITQIPHDFEHELLTIIRGSTHNGRTPRTIIYDESIYHIRVIDRVRDSPPIFPTLSAQEQRTLLRHFEEWTPQHKDYRESSTAQGVFTSQGSRAMSHSYQRS